MAPPVERAWVRRRSGAIVRDYRLQSNVQAVSSALGRKLGEALLSKNEVARFNETLARLLAYNAGVIVHEIHELGVDPASIGLQRS